MPRSKREVLGLPPLQEPEPPRHVTDFRTSTTQVTGACGNCGHSIAYHTAGAGGHLCDYGAHGHNPCQCKQFKQIPPTKARGPGGCPCDCDNHTACVKCCLTARTEACLDQSGMCKVCL